MYKWKPENVEGFLDALKQGKSVSAACRVVDFNYSTVYIWRKEKPEFAAQWAAAIEEGTDKLEDEAWRRAHDGIDKPLHYQGEIFATTKEYSDPLMQIMLKARRPEKYKDRSEQTHNLSTETSALFERIAQNGRAIHQKPVDLVKGASGSFGTPERE